MKGYTGRYLYVDLTNRKIEKRFFDISILKKYVGGMGVNLKLMEEYSKSNTHEFSPNNVIIVGTGPLVGALIPGASKSFATTKFPLNHCIATAAGGMNFGKMLKKAGFDHIVIKGKSEKPVYLFVNNNVIKLINADDLWGQNIYKTTEILKKRHGNRNSIISIGPAGENLVKISMALIDNIASLGKGGLAAVFGSKKLKAIMAGGDEKISIYNSKKLHDTVNPIILSMKNSPKRKTIMKLGSMAGWQHWSEVAGIPYQDWTEIYPREKLRKNFGPEVYLKQLEKGRVACPTCMLPCKEKYWFINENNERDVTYASSFIGRVTAFGARCDVGTIQNALVCHDLCSRLGLDTYSVSASIDYTIKLYEDGIISTKDTGGLILKRDFDTTKQLIKQIAFRENIGNILADGFEHLKEKFGKEFESKIKGMDFIFDARSYRLGTYEFEQIVNPRGGHQHAGGSPTYGARNVSLETLKEFCKAMAVPETSMEKIFYSNDDFNVARLTKHCEEWYSLFSCLGVCSRKIIKPFYNTDSFRSIYYYTTGIEMTGENLKKSAERVWNLMKLLNIREGFTRKKDIFPKSWLRPLKDDSSNLELMDYYGKKVINNDDLQYLLNDYYDEHGWCINHGIPTKKKVKELSLEQEAKHINNQYKRLPGSCHI